MRVKTKDLDKFVRLLKRKHPKSEDIQKLEADEFVISDDETQIKAFSYTLSDTSAVFGKLMHERSEGADGEDLHNFYIGMFTVVAQHKAQVVGHRMDTVGEGKNERQDRVEIKKMIMLPEAERKLFEQYAEFQFARQATMDIAPPMTGELSAEL